MSYYGPYGSGTRLAQHRDGTYLYQDPEGTLSISEPPPAPETSSDEPYQDSTSLEQSYQTMTNTGDPSGSTLQTGSYGEWATTGGGETSHASGINPHMSRRADVPKGTGYYSEAFDGPPQASYGNNDAELHTLTAAPSMVSRSFSRHGGY